MDFNLILTITTSLIITYFSIILITKLHNKIKHFTKLQIKQHKQKNKNIPKKTKELQKKYLKKCLITLFIWLVIFSIIFVICGITTPYNIRETILVRIATYGFLGLLISIITLPTYNWAAIFSTWLTVTWLAILPVIGFIPALIVGLCFGITYSKILQKEKNNIEFKNLIKKSKGAQFLIKALCWPVIAIYPKILKKYPELKEFFPNKN